MKNKTVKVVSSVIVSVFLVNNFFVKAQLQDEMQSDEAIEINFVEDEFYERVEYGTAENELPLPGEVEVYLVEQQESAESPSYLDDEQETAWDTSENELSEELDASGEEALDDTDNQENSVESQISAESQEPEKEEAEVFSLSVSWYCADGYDPEESGLYVFEIQLPGGYYSAEPLQAIILVKEAIQSEPEPVPESDTTVTSEPEPAPESDTTVTSELEPTPESDAAVTSKTEPQAADITSEPEAAAAAVSSITITNGKLTQANLDSLENNGTIYFSGNLQVQRATGLGDSDRYLVKINKSINFIGTGPTGTNIITHGSIPATLKYEYIDMFMITASCELNFEEVVLDGKGKPIMYQDNTDDEVTIRGATMCNGTRALRGGGAIYQLGKITLENCILHHNNSLGSGGGAIHCFNTAELTLIDCTLSYNTASGPKGSGGAVNGWGTTDGRQGSYLNAIRTEFSHNSAAFKGGAVNFPWGSKGSFQECQFLYNVSTGYSRGGGAISTEYGTEADYIKTFSDDFDECYFVGNYSYQGLRFVSSDNAIYKLYMKNQFARRTSLANYSIPFNNYDIEVSGNESTPAYTVTIEAIVAGNGTVSINNKSSEEGHGQVIYDIYMLRQTDESVSITATPATGGSFSEWTIKTTQYESWFSGPPGSPTATINIPSSLSTNRDDIRFEIVANFSDKPPESDDPPVIVTELQDAVLLKRGAGSVLSVTARAPVGSSSDELTYTWYVSDYEDMRIVNVVSGQSGSSIPVSPGTEYKSKYYQVVVTASNGKTATSRVAKVRTEPTFFLRFNIEDQTGLGSTRYVSFDGEEIPGTIGGVPVYYFEKYEKVVIEAEPAAHYHFDHWKKASANFTLSSTTSAVATVTIGGDSYIEAHFAIDQYRVTSSYYDIKTGGKIKGTFKMVDYNDTYTKKADSTIEDNYVYRGYLLDGDTDLNHLNTSDTVTIANVTEDRTITFYYEKRHTVTVTWVDMDGNLMPNQPGQSPYTVADNTEFAIPRDSYPGGAYAAYGYYINDSSTLHLLTTEPKVVITADTSIKIVYASTTVQVKVPTQMVWAAFVSGGGNITSPDFSITNESKFPVDVYLSELTVEKSDGATLVGGTPDAAGNEYNLNLHGDGTCFDDIDKLTAGTLTGDQGHIGQLGTAAGTDDKGTFTFTGKYAGSYVAAKKPELKMQFRFILALPSGE